MIGAGVTSSVTTSTVLVVGDANVDLILQGDIVPRFGQAEQLLESASLVLGSSAGIMASGLAKLGVETTLLAVIGDDEFGRFTRSELDSLLGLAEGGIATIVGLQAATVAEPPAARPTSSRP